MWGGLCSTPKAPQHCRGTVTGMGLWDGHRSGGPRCCKVPDLGWGCSRRGSLSGGGAAEVTPPPCRLCFPDRQEDREDGDRGPAAALAPQYCEYNPLGNPPVPHVPSLCPMSLCPGMVTPHSLLHKTPGPCSTFELLSPPAVPPISWPEISIWEAISIEEIK